MPLVFVVGTARAVRSSTEEPEKKGDQSGSEEGNPTNHATGDSARVRMTRGGPYDRGRGSDRGNGARRSRRRIGGKLGNAGDVRTVQNEE